MGGAGPGDVGCPMEGVRRVALSHHQISRSIWQGLWAAAAEVSLGQSPETCAVSSGFLILLGIFKMEVSAHS